MEKKIIEFVEDNLLDNVEVKKGYTANSYRVIFSSMIASVPLNLLIGFCQSNNFLFYVDCSDCINKLEFVIYK